MASDWVRMKRGLRHDPKVIAMARFLGSQRSFMNWWSDPVRMSCKEHVTEIVTFANVTRVTVAALLDVWASLNNTIKSDGKAPFMALEDIDDIAEIPCFGEAMESVGWVTVQEDESLVFPNFSENNTPSRERAPMSDAERAKRYRERKKARQKEIEGEASRTSRHVTQRREENSIKEKEHACAREVSIPTLQEITVAADRIGMTESEAKRFFDHYEGNNLWINQHGRLIKWQTKLSTWKTNERKYDGSKNTNGRLGRRIDNNAGTFNEGKTGQYATTKLGRVT